MTLPRLHVVIMLLFLLIFPLVAEKASRNEGAAQIHGLLNEMIAEEKIPGIIAAIGDSEGITVIESAGVRRIGSQEAFTTSDTVHIGSCTKAMTAMMMATLVDDHLLSWDTTLIDVFPDRKDCVHPKYHGVTLWQLLTHRAGIPGNAKAWWAYGDLGIKERRLAILKDNLEDASNLTGGEFHYSNLGYMIAGCMAEKLTGSSWESLMKNRLFQPLHMNSAGFGPPGSMDKIDQPLGHVRMGEDWSPRYFDNAEAMGPAGRVHCSVRDWAKFLSQFLPGKNELGLNKETRERLMTPEGEYAAGWIVAHRDWGKGLVLTHSGSNSMWFAQAWVAPEIGRLFAVLTNSRDAESPAICDRVIHKLIAIDREAE